jgi:hypothetical protein
MHTAFYLQGILFFLGTLLIVGVPNSRRARIFLGLVAANAVGNIVIGTLHSGNCIASALRWRFSEATPPF